MSFWKNLFGPKQPGPQIAPEIGRARAEPPRPSSPPGQGSPRKAASSSSRSKPKILDSVMAGNERELRARLNEGGDPNEVANGGVTALTLAAMKGDAACAKVLIEFGANVDVADSNGWTPLMHAVMQGKQLACVQALLDADADVTKTLKNGMGLETLAHNSTPEIGKAIRTRIEQLTAAALSKTTQLSGKITLVIRFEPVRLHIELIENDSHGRTIDIPGTRMNGLIDKSIRLDYSDASGVISKDTVDMLAHCCVDLQTRFSELIKAGKWEFGKEAFRLEQLLPIVVSALEPWTKAHLTFRDFSISFSGG
jgi:Ankyrin repeats (3 copies)